MIFAQSYATFRLSAASVHRHHELAISAVAFIPIFTELGSDMCCWVAKGLVKGTQVSRFSKVDCLAGLLSRNIALLEDKELATDLTCDGR